MPNVVFSDEVVSATDLKKNQRYWFDRARMLGGITIVQGKQADLALVRRQRVAAIEAFAWQMKSVAPFLREIIVLKRSVAESESLPWLHELDREEQEQFLKVFMETFARCAFKEDCKELGELLEDWQATAETHRNTELIEVWKNRGRQEDYVPVT